MHALACQCDVHASVSFCLLILHPMLHYCHCCVYISQSRTLVVMAVLVQMSRMMCVRCVEGVGAHAYVVTTLLSRD